jgi:hypothetical protein
MKRQLLEQLARLRSRIRGIPYNIPALNENDLPDNVCRELLEILRAVERDHDNRTHEINQLKRQPWRRF